MCKDKWTVVENCGYERERVVYECDNYDDAETAYHEQYTESEAAELHVAILKNGSTEW